ncbi:MAG: beta-galactosidase trimerization domain-containing protein [Acidobacteriota bacterium]|nr:beta-galactosidase trimerization domain-containing protein [Acidobacteriota bacterium]
MDRREFLVLPTAALAAPLFAADPIPWQRRIRRIGQLNMTEHDPVELNVEEWADYWQSLKVDAVLVSVTGILAFYQTKVPFHRKGQYLGNRDFFGDCCAAAKKRGLRVIARMSPDLNWADALAAHPEWFQRDPEGRPLTTPDDPRLYRTCMFTSYMTDYIPAIMREVNSLYDVDGLFTNAWPPLGRMPVCACEQCRKLPPPGTIDYWDKFNERTVSLWKLYDSIAKEKKKENFYFANLGGGIGSTASLVQLGELCEWFQCDNQGRGGDAAPIWNCALQGRVCNAVQNGKMATNVTAAWSTGSPVRWRNIAKSEPEDRMWFDETLASGMVPYHHIVSGETGLGEDHRLLDPVRKYFDWTAKYDADLAAKRSIANIGVVMGQRTHLFYKPPRGATMNEHVDGIYLALIEGRFFFDFVHEEKLDAENLRKYTALILPNIAMLSDAQCRQLREFAGRGGSLLATFETSLWDERNRKRPDFGLADIFGIAKSGETIGTRGNAFSARIEGDHPILAGFKDTHLIAGSEYRLPIRPVANPVLTVVPGFPAYPPELAYPTPSHTAEPAVVLREEGRSRRVYFPGDIERTLWRSGHTDLDRLLRNALRWVAGSDDPVTVEGRGIVEPFAWETAAGFAVHLLNYTNPGMHRGWLREFFPIGEQRVRLKLPASARVKQVELLRAERPIPFHRDKDAITFTVPRVEDYEVAAIRTA